jgi:hypothetical protein
MEACAKSAHSAEIERKKIEKQRPIRFRRQRNHFPFLICACVIVDPLQIGGFAAKAGAIINELAVDLASGKIYKRHEYLSIFVAVYL